jgi:hypothetical protein
VPLTGVLKSGRLSGHGGPRVRPSGERPVAIDPLMDFARSDRAESLDGGCRTGSRRLGNGDHDRMKASKSELITSASVVHMPCGKPG